MAASSAGVARRTSGSTALAASIVRSTSAALKASARIVRSGSSGTARGLYPSGVVC